MAPDPSTLTKTQLLLHNQKNVSAYLDLTRKNASGKASVKLRISSHKLLIETERYEPGLPFPRLLAKETLLSHSTDYFMNTH